MSNIESNEVTDAIVSNAEYHDRLLQSLTALDYAGPALKQHHSYIADLKAQLATLDRSLEELEKKTKKERGEHEKLRDSTMSRLTAKLTGRKEKFEASVEKEEREFVEALKAEMAENDQRHVVRRLLEEAYTAKEELVAKEKKHTELKKELDSLYARVFDGPSQSFPEEDQLEYEAFETWKKYEEAQKGLNMESQAAELLVRAHSSMTLAEQNMREALHYAKLDTFSSYPGIDAGHRAGNLLTQAQNNVTQVQGFVGQAMRLSPHVQPVGAVQISRGPVYDAFGGSARIGLRPDSSFRHAQIQMSAAQVHLANNRVQEEYNRAARRRDDAGAALMRVCERLEAQRAELFALRRAIFESVASGVPKPPSYTDIASNPSHHPPGYATARDGAGPVPVGGPVVGEDISSPKPFGGSVAPSVQYSPPPGPPPGKAQATSGGTDLLAHSQEGSSSKASVSPPGRSNTIWTDMQSLSLADFNQSGPSLTRPSLEASHTGSSSRRASRNPFLQPQEASTSEGSGLPSAQVTGTTSPRRWASRNPYAAAMANRSDAFSAPLPASQEFSDVPEQSLK